jgi:tripartite-type tricarboxylate transporter receptor subunit TctC
MIAPEMGKRLGQSVIVENKAGASGVVGGSYVVRAAPDGYTLLVSGISEVQNLLPIPGVVYRPIRGVRHKAELLVVHRRRENDSLVRGFISTLRQIAAL